MIKYEGKVVSGQQVIRAKHQQRGLAPVYSKWVVVLEGDAEGAVIEATEDLRARVDSRRGGKTV